jgi:hypothetical protein
MSAVKCTSAFRIREEDGQRKYTPGDVITKKGTMKFALDNDLGEEISDAEAGIETESKAKAAPKNKAKAAPKNKAG